MLEDPGLREAVTSGLPLRIRVRTELWRKGFFDRLVSAGEVNVAVLQDPLDGSFRIEDGRTERRLSDADAAQAALQSAMVFPLAPRGRGRFYYLATLEIETLSLSDLEELRRWLRGEVQPAVAGKAIGGKGGGARSSAIAGPHPRPSHPPLRGAQPHLRHPLIDALHRQLPETGTLMPAEMRKAS